VEYPRRQQPGDSKLPLSKGYRYPKETQWLGWLENGKGDVIAFVSLIGEIVWDW